MESKNVLMGCILIISFSFAACDIEKDREKCSNQLVGLSTCLPFVSGEDKAPPSDCCTGFKQVLKDHRECICLLIKDRNDPSLGLKINATLALSLPVRCNAPVNQTITDCAAILHLPPNSPDAKVFEDFTNSGKKSHAPATASGSSSSGTTSTPADHKSDGGEKRGSLEAQMVSGLLMAVVAVHTFINL